MTLRLFNSLGRELQEFRPLEEGEVRMYTCGPTVWNYAHMGNLRTFVFEDVLRRHLKFKGYRVTQVMNITDVEDNIIKGMKQSGKGREELTDFYERAFMADLETLGVERAEAYPRATEHVPEMLGMIGVLLEKGFAYRAGDGSVYFAVSKFPRYGALSGVRPGELKAGARVAQDHYEKEEANDFALWKAWDLDDGEVYWESELGKGRPGWSIECSAMSMKYLGETFDIHTGGVDNRFPHHENEIAQSEAATGKKFVNYWLHSEHLTLKGEGMHKSVGNVVYLKDLLSEGWDPLTIRFFLVSSHYRDPVDLTEDSLRQADTSRKRVQDLVSRLMDGEPNPTAEEAKLASDLIEGFTTAMDDDLNTPRALASLFTLVKEANLLLDRGPGGGPGSPLLEALGRIDAVLGFLSFEKAALTPELAALVEKREEARRGGDYPLADRIRAELLKNGVEVEDTPSGPRLHRLRVVK
jgi:cysteinyl-tRNA synthetase